MIYLPKVVFPHKLLVWEVDPEKANEEKSEPSNEKAEVAPPATEDQTTNDEFQKAFTEDFHKYQEMCGLHPLQQPRSVTIFFS